MRLALVLMPSSPVWEAWIEISTVLRILVRPTMSSPVWEAWIEILYKNYKEQRFFVVSRMGGVD